MTRTTRAKRWLVSAALASVFASHLWGIGAIPGSLYGDETNIGEIAIAINDW